MKVHILSDLHNEFSEYILDATFDAETFVLAGDYKAKGRPLRACVACGALGSQLYIGRHKVTLCGDCINKYQSPGGHTRT